MDSITPVPGQASGTGVYKIKMRTLFFIFFAVFLGRVCPAQTQTMLFEKTWDEFYDNALLYADELPNGDYFLVGLHVLTAPEPAEYPAQVYACRMDARGNIVWEKDWGYDGGIDGVSKVIKHSANTYVIAGYGYSGISGGESDFTVTKINTDGDILFYKYYDFSYQDYGCDIYETSDSSFIISGRSGSTPNTWHPAFIKIDSNGNEIWRKTQPSLSGYIPSKIFQTPDKGYICLGQTTIFNNSYYAKYDSTGTMNWIKYPFGLGDTITNRPALLRVNANAAFDIVYSTYYTDSLLKIVYALYNTYDSNGTCLTSKRSYSNMLIFFENQSDSMFEATSENGSFYQMNSTNFIKKVGLEGDDSLHKALYYCIQTSDGGYLGVGCYSPNYNTYYPTFYIVKFGDGRYKPDEFSESVNVYPNPSRDGNITLTFDMLTDGDVDVKIYSSDGRLVYSNAIFCYANSHTELPVRLDENSAAAGMYILQARTPEIVIRKKILVGRKTE